MAPAQASSPFFARALIDECPLKLECGVVSGTRLLLGGVDGTLLVYGPLPAPDGGSGSRAGGVADSDADPAPPAPELLLLRRGFAPRAIVQLEVHERLGLLVVLSDGGVHVHTLAGDMSRVQSPPDLRQCIAVALTPTEQPGDCLLAASSRKSVVILRWDTGARAFGPFAEVSLEPQHPGLAAGFLSHISDAVGVAVNGTAHGGAAVLGLGSGVGSGDASVGGGGCSGGSAGAVGGGGTGAGAGGPGCLLVWLGDSKGPLELIVGTRKEYLAYDVAAGRAARLFPTARGGMAPVGARLALAEVLLCQDRTGCFVGLRGEPSRKYVLHFREVPLLVAYTEPFVLSLHPAQPGGSAAQGVGGAGAVVEVRLMQSQDVVQTLRVLAPGSPLPVQLIARPPVAPEPTRAVQAPAAAVGVGRDCPPPHAVLVIAPAGVWRLRPLSLASLRRRLVRAERFAEAAQLCEPLHGVISASAEAARRSIGTLHGFRLLTQGRFEAAMEELLAARTSPVDVLSAYPRLLPAPLRARRVYVRLEGAPGAASGGGAGGGAARGAPAWAGSGDSGADDAVMEVAPLQLDQQPAIVALYGALRIYLERARRMGDLFADGVAVADAVARAGAGGAVAEARAGAGGAARGGAGLSASDGAGAAPATEDVAAAEVRSAADTALLKVLLSIDQPAVLPFVLQPNACALAEAESILARYRQWAELAALYEGRGLHAQALQLLQSLGQRAPTAAEPVPEALRGPGAVVAYLRRLGPTHLDLILEFSEWPLKAAPNLGLAIFLENESEGEETPAESAAGVGGGGGGGGGRALPFRAEPLPLEPVHAHISRVCGPARASVFLEAALSSHPATAAPRLHTALARNLLARVASLEAAVACGRAHGGVGGEGAGAGGGGVGAALAALRSRCHAFLSASNSYSAEALLAELRENGAGAQNLVAAEALAHAPATADAPAASPEVEVAAVAAGHTDKTAPPVDGCGGGGGGGVALGPERALLLGRLGRHEAALRVLVEEMGNLQAAEDHCARASARTTAAVAASAGDAAGALQTSPYDSLLQVLLRPADGRSPQVDIALGLLRSHASKLDPALALNLLPADTPLEFLAHFVVDVMRAKAEAARAARVRRNLLKTDTLAARARLRGAHRTRTIVGPDTLCGACGKRVGTTVFARYPNGVIVHFACSEDELHVCPVTREDFRGRAQLCAVASPVARTPSRTRHRARSPV